MLADWINKCHFGDARKILRKMIAAGVRVGMIICSPPYWGLRSYLPATHPLKHLEMGSEPTLQEFIAGQVELFGLARQVLADDGTLWVNMGDAYAGSFGAQGHKDKGGMSGAQKSAMPSKAVAGIRASYRRDKEPMPRSDVKVAGLKPKDLMGQPWRLAFALQDDGWWLRQDIVWSKPNPMPESIKDRFTKAHEFLFLLSKKERYYFNFAAVQEPASGTAHPRKAGNGASRVPAGWATGDTPHTAIDHQTAQSHRKVAPKEGLNQNDSAYGDGKSERMGRGAGWRKLAEDGSGTKNNGSFDESMTVMPKTRNPRDVWHIPSEPYSGAHFATFPTELVRLPILAGCKPGGTVLDLFFGSGTTGQVAVSLGMNWIGIELNEANEPLQARRLADRIGRMAQRGLDLHGGDDDGAAERTEEPRSEDFGAAAGD